MSEVLYRKWRPRRLDQVVGQQPVTQTLRQAVSQDRVAHAYLFCGPRGTGKTSTARILAKAVNCLSPRDGEPDNECGICAAINESRALDLIDVDAASNRSIDDIRNLNEKIHFTPNEARFKVYIIDEVHMLTPEAFNALLKTLEEPPAHAILILATTEPHKVPLTIVSRCQRFDFRRIPMEAMVDKLAELCRDEGVEADAETLALISRTSGGSLRDAENLLEQAVVSYGTPLTGDQVRDLLGLGGDDEALDLVAHTVDRDLREGLAVINRVAGQGSDLRQLHRGAMDFLRGVLLLKAGAAASLGYSEEITARLGQLAESTSMDRVVQALKVFGRVDFRRDTVSPLPLELALVESSVDPPVETQPRRSEGAPAQQAPAQRPAAPRPQRPSPPPPVAQPPRPAPAGGPPVSAVGPPAVRSDTVAPAAALSGPAAKLESQWDGIVRSLRHTGRRFKLGALLRGCRERHVADGVITLKFPYASHVERMQQELDDPETRRAVQNILAEVLNGAYEIHASLAGADGGAPRKSVARSSHLVRAAQAMGARVVGEKEEDDDEQENAPSGAGAAGAAGPAAATEHGEAPEAPGGA